MHEKELKHERQLADKAFEQLYEQMFTNCGIDAYHKEFWKVIADKAKAMIETQENTVLVTTHRYCSRLGCRMKVRTIITTQHAYSLSGLVKYFRAGITMGKAPIPSEKLTIAYCDELIKDLEEGD